MVDDAAGNFAVENSNGHIATPSTTSMKPQAHLYWLRNEMVVTGLETLSLYRFMVVSTRLARLAKRAAIFSLHLEER